MVVYHEYQIPLPLSVDEYRIAQLYTIFKFSEKESTDNEDGDGVEVLRNEPFERDGVKGQFTHKIYHLNKKAPAWVVSLLPKRALQLEEKSWNSYPTCVTEVTNPWLTRFKLKVESAYLADRQPRENAVHPPSSELKHRVVEVLDIAAADAVDVCLRDEDLSGFKSKRTGRGPFSKGWQQTCDPCMVAYKFITVDAPYWGFGPQLEKYISKVMQRKLNLETNRKAVCWMDEWIGLTMEDVRRMEKETFERMNQERKMKYGVGNASTNDLVAMRALSAD